MNRTGVLLVAVSQIAFATASKQFMIQATVLTGNNTEILYLNDNQFGPFEASNYYEWFGSNQIVKVDTDYCLQVQPGVHQGCAGQAWTCDGWNYIGTENYRGYDTCTDSSDRWVTIESAQTVGYPDEPVVLLKEHNSGMCAYLDSYHDNDEDVLYLGLRDCDATNRAQLVLTVHN